MRSRFMVFTMANVGLPGTSGFVGEFLTLLGAFRANTWVAFFATTGVILSAAYALWLYRRVMFGPLEKPSLKGIADLNRREIAILAPLVLLVIYYGVQPGPVLDAFAASTDALVKSYQAALSADENRGAGRSLRLPAMNPALAIPAFGPAAAGDHPRRRRARARPGRRLSAASGSARLVNLAGAGAPRRRARRRAGAAGRARRRPSTAPSSSTASRKFMKVADAARLRRGDRHVDRLSAPRGHRPLRVPDPHPALDARHADADLGERPHRALSRPRAA